MQNKLTHKTGVNFTNQSVKFTKAQLIAAKSASLFHLYLRCNFIT